MEPERFISILEELASAIFEINKMAVTVQGRIRDIITLLKTESAEDEAMNGGTITISDELSIALRRAGYETLAAIQEAEAAGTLGKKDGLTPKETEDIKKILNEYTGLKPGPEPAGNSNKGGFA